MSRTRCVIAIALLTLQACSSNASKEPDLASTPTEAPVEANPMKPAEIMQALSNKSFRYERGSSSGVITFAPDGTFIYQEDGKGEGTGIWQASAGQLCQALNPTTFLPKGTRSECHPFKWSGDAYIAGPSRLQPV